MASSYTQNNNKDTTSPFLKVHVYFLEGMEYMDDFA